MFSSRIFRSAGERGVRYGLGKVALREVRSSCFRLLRWLISYARHECYRCVVAAIRISGVGHTMPHDARSSQKEEACWQTREAAGFWVCFSPDLFAIGLVLGENMESVEYM